MSDLTKSDIDLLEGFSKDICLEELPLVPRKKPSRCAALLSAATYQTKIQMAEMHNRSEPDPQCCRSASYLLNGVQLCSVHAKGFLFNMVLARGGLPPLDQVMPVPKINVESQPTHLRETFLYRHFDKDGNLLYIGIAANLEKRTAAHRHSHWFPQIDKVTSEAFESRFLALEAEEKAIQQENPKYNVAQRNWRTA